MDKNSLEIKNKMMKLWKDTFHDSDAYISLIFDNYFNIDLVEYHEERNQIVSALLGIPYYFSNGELSIPGLYLCGLATKEEFRQKGIMNNLINRINDKARLKGYAFSFLIPASNSLRIYYQNKGFVNGIYRVEDRYTSIHDFYKDGLISLNREDEKIKKYRQKYYTDLTTEIVDKPEKELLDKIIGYIRNNEHKKREYLTLQHTPDDIGIIIKENNISSGNIIYVKDKNDLIKGVVFINENNRGEISVSKIYYEDNCAFYKLLDGAKRLYPECSMGVWRYPEESNRKLIWTQNYIPGSADGVTTTSYGTAERVYDTSMHSRSYGMIKILNLYEILNFLAKDNPSLKFSILVKKDIFDSDGSYYKVTSGKVENIENVDEDKIKQLKQNNNFSILTVRDISEILFRKKDVNNVILDAFGIPRLALNMSLMLD